MTIGRKPLPAHARKFRGKALNIPEEDTFLLKYQEDWVKDQSLMRIMEKTRRCGVTFGTGYDLVRQHSLATMMVDSWISSRDDTTAKLFLQTCMGFARVLDAGARSLGQQVLDADKGHSAYVGRFSNETALNSLASNPDVFAGKGGNVVLDEFALRDDPRMVYAIAMATIDWGGRLAIVSTHRGSDNFFNQTIRKIREKGNPQGFSLHRVTLQDALDQGFLWKLQTKLPDGDPRLDMDEAAYFDYQRNRAADEESFLQEYMCSPADDASAFLSYDLIASCEYRGAVDWETDLEHAKGPLYVGVDIGRDHDLTVIWVLERLGDVMCTRRVVEMHKQEFSAQEHELYSILRLPKVRRCCIDQTGIGRQFAERATKKFGKYRVEGVTFAGPVKEELAYPLRASFEDRSVRIPERNEIRTDLRAIKKETTAAGNIRFTADRGKNGHSDRFWALALAIHAGKQTGNLSTPVPFNRGGQAARANNSRFAMSRKREMVG